MNWLRNMETLMPEDESKVKWHIGKHLDDKGNGRTLYTLEVERVNNPNLEEGDDSIVKLLHLNCTHVIFHTGFFYSYLIKILSGITKAVSHLSTSASSWRQYSQLSQARNHEVDSIVTILFLSCSLLIL